MSKPKEFWILEYPGLGSSMRNYGVSFERKNFEAMFSNGALTNFYSAIKKDDYDKLKQQTEALAEAIREAPQYLKELASIELRHTAQYEIMGVVQDIYNALSSYEKFKDK